MVFKSLKQLCLITCILSLTSCSILGPVKSKPKSTYDLREVPIVPNDGARIPIILLINTPDVSQTFNSNQMAYTLRPYQVSYYGINEWTATPAQMLQPLLLQALQSQHRFRGVVTVPSIALYDYVLDTKILDFIMDWTLCPPAARLLVSAQIIRSRSNKVVATKRIEVLEPINGQTPYAGARAMNHAAAHAVREITRFVDNVIK